MKRGYISASLCTRSRTQVRATATTAVPPHTVLIVSSIAAAVCRLLIRTVITFQICNITPYRHTTESGYTAHTLSASALPLVPVNLQQHMSCTTVVLL